MVPGRFRRSRTSAAAWSDAPCSIRWTTRPPVRALFRALDRWVVDDMPPPPSAYPQIADGTLTSPDAAGWPAIPGFQLPQQPLRAFHLNFGADWAKGIVSVDPPEVGKPFASAFPRSTPTATFAPASGCPTSPFRSRPRPAGTTATRRSALRIGWRVKSDRIFRSRRRRADRERANDPRPSIDERYRGPRRVRRQVRGGRAGPRRAWLPAAGRRGGPAQHAGGALRLGDRAPESQHRNPETEQTKKLKSELVPESPKSVHDRQHDVRRCSRDV